MPIASVGKFEIPELLVELGDLDGTVPDFTVPYIGLDRVHADCRWSPYSCTPLDLLQFAWTGGDGIHFGFLTDFGAVADPQQAPIVCVSPSTTPPITIVARNLYDFLCALCPVKDGNDFSDLKYHFSRTGDPWWNTFGVDPTDECYEEQMRTARIVTERLRLREIPDYRGYLADLWAERAKSELRRDPRVLQGRPMELRLSPRATGRRSPAGRRRVVRARPRFEGERVRTFGK